MDVTDLYRLFEWLALKTEGKSAICYATADVNADGKVDFTDTVFLSKFLFSGDYELLPMPPTTRDCSGESAGVPLRSVRVTVLSPVSAMVSWETPYPTDTRVNFGVASDSLTQEVHVDEGVTYHQALLSGLTPGQQYYVQGISAGANEVSVSDLASFDALPVPAYRVRPDHPRLLLTAEELPAIKARVAAGGDAKDLWDSLGSWASTAAPTILAAETLPEDVGERLRAVAFRGLIANSANVQNEAIAIALKVSQQLASADLRSATEGLAYVYDWCNNRLSPTEKTTLENAILRSTRALADIKDNEYVTGLSHGNSKSAIIGALSIVGDVPAAASILDELVAHYRYGFLATWRRFASDGGGSSKGWWYTSYALPFELEFFAAWRSATGEDLFVTERSWCEPLLDWFLYGLRGDDSFIREGDAKVFYGINATDRLFGLLMAKEYGNPRGEWLARLGAEVATPWGPYLPLDILWGGSGLAPKGPSGPTSKLFRDAGTVICRDSWRRDAAIASFRSAEAYTLGHSHRDNCSFTLFYKGGLAVDSGLYDDFDSEHHDNYYTRTIAHNAVTVYKPDETFELYGTTHANDGGQLWLKKGEDVPHHWPATAEDTVDRAKGYRLGGIPRFEDTTEYTYALGDGTPSYSKEKMSRYLRHFLWLKDVEGWAQPALIIFDDITSTRPEYKKTYLLHTENQPIVEGNRVTATNGEGKLFQYTLVPGEGSIQVVGGRGKEFWVDGQNFAPIRGARDKEEPGAWRVEVSPVTQRTQHRMLHVLFPGELDATAPTEPTSFVTGTMQGCRVGEWTILFDFGYAPEKLTYSNLRGNSPHVIFGAVPQADYDLFLNGVLQGRFTASFEGTLRFDLMFAGVVNLLRVVE